MSTQPHFVILDGYPAPARRVLEDGGATLAGDLYARLLRAHLPAATFDVVHPADSADFLPAGRTLADYAAVLWTGSNLTIFHTDDARVARMIDFAQAAFDLGVPSFGSCWGLQMAAVAAGGEVQAHPGGREMGVGRKIVLTEEGREHPMFEGRSLVFDHLVSHEDEVTRVPAGGVVLARNRWCIQAMAVTHGKGTFWATQFHPEYDLHEVAGLVHCRVEKLIRGGFFQVPAQAFELVERLEALHADPTRKDLAWGLGIDEDLLDTRVRQMEFANWLRHQVMARLAG